jgi:hypothetical protein
MVAAGWKEATVVIPLKKEVRFPKVSYGGTLLAPSVSFQRRVVSLETKVSSSNG